ncbi:CYTH domain-containing protein [Candidatus Woesearchaeota archaeon]|nr:CYTH domain-containing protein [Candidatus Woesearchaeota archaeon]
MEEVEVKILEVDRPKCEKILLDLGAEKIFEGTIKTVAFDNGNKTLTTDKQFIRLRKENEKNVLGFKGRIKNKEAKVMEEIETEVGDFDKTVQILERVGFTIWTQNTKDRISYKLEGVRFDFDKYNEEYSYIPEFLEIEGENIEVIRKYAKILGFEDEELKPWGFGKLNNKYKS